MQAYQAPCTSHASGSHLKAFWRAPAAKAGWGKGSCFNKESDQPQFTQQYLLTTFSLRTAITYKKQTAGFSYSVKMELINHSSV